MRCRLPRRRTDAVSRTAKPAFSALILTASLAATPVVAASDSPAPFTDLRGIVIGMTAEQLPPTGYRKVSCLDSPNQGLDAWADWSSCTARPDGLRGLRLEYYQPGEDDTMVAGHPVDLGAFLDKDGRVVRIEIKTTDKTSLFHRKHAYMLGQQAKQHYGPEGWTCKTTAPAANEEPVAEVYVNEVCSKEEGDRAIEVTSRFFHKVGGSPRDFVSDSLVVVNFRL
jgi:hypothetical protein